MAKEKISKEDKQREIDKLVKVLKNSEDQAEKRSVRAKLRGLGHSGGTGEPRGRKPGSGKVNKKTKKGKRAKPLADSDE